MPTVALVYNGNSGFIASPEGYHQETTHQRFQEVYSGHRWVRLALQRSVLLPKGAVRRRTHWQVLQAEYSASNIGFVIVIHVVSSAHMFRYVRSCMTRLHLLLHHGVTPIVVFDGDKLPAKEGTEATRHKYVEIPPEVTKKNISSYIVPISCLTSSLWKVARTGTHSTRASPMKNCGSHENMQVQHRSARFVWLHANVSNWSSTYHTSVKPSAMTDWYFFNIFLFYLNMWTKKLILQ